VTIRQALHTNGPLPEPLLVEAAAHLHVAVSDVMEFKDCSVREFYSEGVCGGALIPLSRVGVPTQGVHVPLAHQSALAGVILASRLIVDLLGRGPDHAVASRLDVLRRVPPSPTMPVAKDPRGICICQDRSYQATYKKKYRSNDDSSAGGHY